MAGGDLGCFDGRPGLRGRGESREFVFVREMLITRTQQAAVHEIEVSSALARGTC